MKLLLAKLKEVGISVLPITLIVLILHFTITQIESNSLYRFLIGATIIVLGLTIFLIGVELAISPVGEMMGRKLIDSNKLWIIIIGGLALGFFITIAEPNLHVLGEQIQVVTANLLSKLNIVIVVSLGFAIAIAIGLIRLIFSFRLNILLLILYGLILILSLFVANDFIALAFDSAGAATGVLTIPFILALNLGVSAYKNKQGTQAEDSFGFVALSAAGVILSILILGIITNIDKISASIPTPKETSSILKPFLNEIISQLGVVAISLLPLFILFMLFQIFAFKLTKKKIVRILKGFFYSFIGLVLFLTGVNAGFMEVGRIIGESLASKGAYIVYIVAFVLGMLTVIAEPSVYVLTHQIEDVTSGSLRRSIILVTLAIGVGIAVFLSVFRILVPGVELWHILLIGYGICVILSFFVPRLFVGMSFDSGSVSSGPMSATFILAFSQGVAFNAGNPMDGFGLLALVSLSPVLALQILGFIYKIKLAKGGSENV